MASRLMSTRARAKLWKLQEAVRTASRERDRLMHLLNSSRAMFARDAWHELRMEFALADQEYRFAVNELQRFCEVHGSENADSHAAT